MEEGVEEGGGRSWTAGEEGEGWTKNALAEQHPNLFGLTSGGGLGGRVEASRVFGKIHSNVGVRPLETEVMSIGSGTRADGWEADASSAKARRFFSKVSDLVFTLRSVGLVPGRTMFNGEDDPVMLPWDTTTYGVGLFDVRLVFRTATPYTRLCWGDDYLPVHG